MKTVILTFVKSFSVRDGLERYVQELMGYMFDHETCLFGSVELNDAWLREQDKPVSNDGRSFLCEFELINEQYEYLIHSFIEEHPTARRDVEVQCEIYDSEDYRARLSRFRRLKVEYDRLLRELAVDGVNINDFKW